MLRFAHADKGDIMVFIELIRHARTAGNEQKRYIGATDEPLSQNGKNELARLIQKGIYPPAEAVFTSPRRRCLETAALIYGSTPCKIMPELAECDFGEFEGKTYEELAEKASYQNWINSQGRSCIPGGEAPELFKTRSRRGFEKVILKILSHRYLRTAVMLHGGSIMAIMESYAPGGGAFMSGKCKTAATYVLQSMRQYGGKAVRSLQSIE